MTQMIAIDIPQGANLELLREELRAAFGDEIAGTSRTPEAFYIVVEDAAPEDIGEQMQAVIDAHDPNALTATQAALAAAKDAPDRAQAIPGWALWDEQQAIDYINETVTDLASAKTVLLAMARLLVAQRDALWPGLGVE